MLFLKALFITFLLMFGSVQCVLEPNSLDPRIFRRREKVASTSELLSELVRTHTRKGLKDIRKSVESLHLPELETILKDAGEYAIIRLEVAGDEAKKLMKDVEGISATLFGYRERSLSDYCIENAARFFLLALGMKIIRKAIESTLRLFKSPLVELF